jgi:hypothetical protein
MRQRRTPRGSFRQRTDRVLVKAVGHLEFAKDHGGDPGGLDREVRPDGMAHWFQCVGLIEVELELLQPPLLAAKLRRPVVGRAGAEATIE